MKKRKHKQRKNIATSNWNKDNLEPRVQNKVRFVKRKIDFTLNEGFLEDKEKLKSRFSVKNKPMSDYFIKLSNELKNKNKVQDIFKYAELYLAGNFSISDIKRMQTRPKIVRISSRPTARIAKKL